MRAQGFVDALQLPGIQGLGDKSWPSSAPGIVCEPLRSSELDVALRSSESCPASEFWTSEEAVTRLACAYAASAVTPWCNDGQELLVRCGKVSLDATDSSWKVWLFGTSDEPTFSWKSGKI